MLAGHGISVVEASEALADPNCVVISPDYNSLRSDAPGDRLLRVRRCLALDHSDRLRGHDVRRQRVALEHQGPNHLHGRVKRVDSIKDLIDAEAAASEQGEADQSDRDLPEGTTVTRGRGRSRTLQVRLNQDEYAELEKLAKARDLPVSTVARSMLLSDLPPRDDAGGTLDRIERDVAALRRAIAG